MLKISFVKTNSFLSYTFPALKFLNFCHLRVEFQAVSKKMRVEFQAVSKK